MSVLQEKNKKQVGLNFLLSYRKKVAMLFSTQGMLPYHLFIDDIIQKTTDAGYLNVSSPELTALDLFAYVEKIGMNRITTVLHELAQSIKVTSLSRTIKKYPNTSVIHRLGYIIDKVLDEKKIAEVLLKNLKDRNLFPVLLTTQKPKNGEIL